MRTIIIYGYRHDEQLVEARKCHYYVFPFYGLSQISACANDMGNDLLYVEYRDSHTSSDVSTDARSEVRSKISKRQQESSRVRESTLTSERQRAYGAQAGSLR